LHHEIEKYHQHIPVFSVIIIIINSHLENYSDVKPVRFSLSRRDGDSNRLLPSWGKIPSTNPACFARAAIGHLWYCTGRGAGGNRLIRNQPNCQVAQALLAHGQIRVPAHPLSSMRRVKRPQAGPYQSYSASRLTSPRSQLSGRCVQLPTDSRQGEQVLGGTGERQPHSPGTLFVSKPPV
jgi:hypothetical protein